MFVTKGKALYFVPDGTGKYEFCSKDVYWQIIAEIFSNAVRLQMPIGQTVGPKQYE